MELNRENFEVGSSRTGFAAWVEENPRMFYYLSLAGLVVFVFLGGFLKLSIGYSDAIDSSDSIVKSLLASCGIIPDVRYLVFYLIPLPLFWWLMYKYVKSYTLEPYSKSSLFIWASSVASGQDVEERFDDYAERKEKEILENGGKGKEQWGIILASLFFSLILSVVFAFLFVTPVVQYVNNLTAKESKEVCTVVTGKYTYKVKSSRCYRIRCTFDGEHAALGVNEETYEEVRPGDTIVLSVRYGFLGYIIDDYNIFTRAARDRELKKRMEAEVAAKLAAEAAPKPKTEKELVMDKGTAQLAQYIKENLFDVVETTNGTVTVIFSVDKNGRISNVEMQKKLHRRVDKAFLEAVENMKEWPAVKNLKLKSSATVNLHVSYRQGKPSSMECTIIPHTGVVTYNSVAKY